ncbi:MAG: hypothetical protein ACREOH_19445 [Candidatus Entotheonellia bacterium]
MVVPLWEDPWENFKQLVWPIVAAGYCNAAVSMRMTRSAVLEVMREDHIRTAWAIDTVSDLRYNTAASLAICSP